MMASWAQCHGAFKHKADESDNLLSSGSQGQTGVCMGHKPDLQILVLILASLASKLLIPDYNIMFTLSC